MKKISIILSWIVLFCVQVFSTHASQALTREDFFVNIWNVIEVPNSYKYIELFYSDVEKESRLYDALQKIVYLWKLENSWKSIKPHSILSSQQVYAILSKIADTNRAYIVNPAWINSHESLSENIANLDVFFIDRILPAEDSVNQHEWNSVSSSEVENKLLILENVYENLRINHVDNDSFTDEDLIDWAIKWLAEGTKDPYTIYFPRKENQVFQDSLNWEYEWIWAYVNMTSTWWFIIEWIIPWSPAELWGLRSWDKVLKIDDYTIKSTDSAQEVIQIIKGPKWSQVKLFISRGWTEVFLELTRWSVKLEDISTELLNNQTFYIALQNFDTEIWENFWKAIAELEQHKWVDKLILDLRWNPGWYLDQTQEILSWFIEKWKATSVIEYKSGLESLLSNRWENIDIKKYEIIILIDGWTASASEIIALSLKDYFPDAVTLVWEQTFWKWSVQTQRYYPDGSALKYTIAKWYSWNTKISIDWLWITPDIIIPFDVESYNSLGTDTQLEKALNL